MRPLGQIQTLQDALWRRAILPPTALAAQATPDAVGFDVDAAVIATEPQLAAEVETGPHSGVELPDPGRRRYRRTPRTLGPRTDRTRPDPFADVWDEVRQELEARPECTAKAAFQALQQRYPGQFPDVQLRTLQRRVKEWRASVILAFDDQWLTEEPLAQPVLPVPLRAVPAERSAIPVG